METRSLTVEFGNRLRPATPILRPALENNFQAIIKRFKNNTRKVYREESEATR